MSQPKVSSSRTSCKVLYLVTSLKEMLQEDLPYVVEDPGMAEPFFEVIQDIEELRECIFPLTKKIS
jgi:hypothetical protein